MEERNRNRSQIVVRVERSTTAGYCDLAGAAELSGLHPDLIRDLCRAGFVETRVSDDEEQWYFDDHALYMLRRVHEWREHKGINLRGIRLILELFREMDRMEREIRFLRDRLG
ncbi:MAG TPA: chaperone modulator CbpM [Verrucomicrobiales bacterium]|nr:chaperone modulator CbpM [Verrucomicrobiales bacterium]